MIIYVIKRIITVKWQQVQRLVHSKPAMWLCIKLSMNYRCNCDVLECVMKEILNNNEWCGGFAYYFNCRLWQYHAHHARLLFITFKWLTELRILLIYIAISSFDRNFFSYKLNIIQLITNNVICLALSLSHNDTRTMQPANCIIMLLQYMTCNVVKNTFNVITFW